MKILYLCHRVPYPPTKGERIRAYHHITQLAKRHEVRLACLTDVREDLEQARFLESACASVEVVYRSPIAARAIALGAVVGGGSLSVTGFHSPRLQAIVDRRIREWRPDVLYAYTTSTASYLEGAAARALGAPRVIDFVDADSEKWRAYGSLKPFPQSALYALEGERLARYEGRIASTFDASLFVSEAEAAIVRPRAAGRRMTVLSNGVDLEGFRPAGDGGAASSAVPPAEPGAASAPRIVFTGAMGYYPNADAVASFAREVFPTVRAAVPAAEFVIVGRDPSPEVRRLATLPGVVVTGTVPDVRPYLAGAAVAVAPFRISRGVPNKVLEAMASGLPVVGTRVSFQALAAGEADGIRIADTTEAFAASVLALLADDALRREEGRRARLYVERHHDWSRVGAALDSLLASLVASPAAGSVAR